jgi:hypothetical protein
LQELERNAELADQRLRDHRLRGSR